MKEEKNQLSLGAIKSIFINALKLLKLFGKEKRGLFLICSLALATVLTSLSPFLGSGARGYLINELVKIANKQSADTRLIIISTVVFLSVGLITSIVYSVREYFDRLFDFLVEEKLEILIAQKKGEIDIAVHEDPKMNDLLNKVSEGSWRVGNFTGRNIWVMQDAIRIVAASFIIFAYGWWIFFVIFLGNAFRLLAESYYGQRVWSIHTAKAETRRRFWDSRWRFNEVYSLRELKLFQNIQYFLSIIRKLFLDFQNEEKKAERKRLTLQLISLFFSHIAFAVAVVWFIHCVIKGELLIGTFTFVIASISNLEDALSSFFYKLGSQYQDNLFVNDLFSFLAIKPTIKKSEKGLRLNPSITPEIVFDKVSFTYPGSKTMILKNLSLTVPAGEKIALVGINGAGKTTIVKLLCRFYDPDKGRILIGGRDLKEIDLESWYNQLGALFQDYSNYHFVVKQAIAIGRTGKKSALEKVKDAAKASEADIFIGEWEKNYRQMLGKQFSEGVEPSTGQWQKLALARVFYRDPRVMILDEPTSSIDTEAEEKIFRKIESLPKDRTVIFISHRFSTVREANKIVVIEKGRISEQGTHKELMDVNKTYARLFKLQARKYK